MAEPDSERARLRTLVHAFYDELRRDDDIGPLFERAIGHDWQSHLDRMVEFWATLMLGSRSFTGDVFGRHMAIRGLEPAMFARWQAVWKKHTEALFEPARAAELQRIAAGITGNLSRGLARRDASLGIARGR
jgi:hemoglobin